MNRGVRLGRILALPGVVALVVLAFAASASQARITHGSALKARAAAGYSTGVFRWSAVRHTDHYEFELASDKKFNSPVLGRAGSFSTWSTSATLPLTLQDGKYWWRVRAVRKNGGGGMDVSRVPIPEMPGELKGIIEEMK